MLLRYLDSQDAVQTYADWLNDPEVTQYLEVRHQFHTPETCRAFIHEANRDDATHLFGMFLKDGLNHIGNIKLGFINSMHARGEISIFIGDKKQWGMGLASEAIHAVTNFGFNSLNLERIEAGCYEGNLASLHAFQGVGYRVEGLRRSHVISNGQRSNCYWLGALKNELISNR